MANADHTGTVFPDRSTKIQQSRRYKDWRPGNQKDAPLYPWLKLSGQWIEHAGFTATQQVRITVEYGKLTIAAE